MAKKKFTQLPIASTLDGSEIVALVQDGTSKQSTVQEISGLSGVSLKRGGNWNWAANSNAFPVSADDFTFYLTEDNRGVPGDGVAGDGIYIEADTLMMSRVPGASTAAQYKFSW